MAKSDPAAPLGNISAPDRPLDSLPEAEEDNAARATSGPRPDADEHEVNELAPWYREPTWREGRAVQDVEPLRPLYRLLLREKVPS